MKKHHYWFPKRTVKRIVKIIQANKNMNQLRESLKQKFHFNDPQIEYVLSYPLHDLVENKKDVRQQFIKDLKGLEHE